VIAIPKLAKKAYLIAFAEEPSSALMRARPQWEARTIPVGPAVAQRVADR
jgi:hypothetical protein